MHPSAAWPRMCVAATSRGRWDTAHAVWRGRSWRAPHVRGRARVLDLSGERGAEGAVCAAPRGRASTTPPRRHRRRCLPRDGLDRVRLRGRRCAPRTYRRGGMAGIGGAGSGLLAGARRVRNGGVAHVAAACGSATRAGGSRERLRCCTCRPAHGVGTWRVCARVPPRLHRPAPRRVP